MNTETKPTTKSRHVARIRTAADPKPRHAIRTSCSQYFFGAGKAAVSNPHTKKREPSKLPTTLEELPEQIKGKPQHNDRR